MSSGKGVDIGTNMIVAASVDEAGNSVFRKQRDAFFRIIPKTEVNKSSIQASLDKRGANYITDNDNSFVVIGEDALNIAIERNSVAQRPMTNGVISPKDKASLPMLKLILEALLGKVEDNSKLFYSVPGKPIDGDFDIAYHTEIMGMYLKQLGYNALPINEAYAVALSELIDDGLTGIAISFGAGMTNICVVHEGDSLLEFSVLRGGDFIDNSVGNALDVSPSIVQLEKEAGINLFNTSTKIEEAVAVYYSVVMNYIVQNIVYEFKNKNKVIPSFRNPIPVVVSGGLTLAEGFVDKFNEALKQSSFPIEVSSVRLASDPMTAVANGSLLAANI